MLAILVCAALELVLRAFHHEILPQEVSNEVATGYHVGPDGIYVWRPEMKSVFMKLSSCGGGWPSHPMRGRLHCCRRPSGRTRA